jgi:NAD(P)-dependent dehydrogenase (short-subunit alcohol dehydrogenase family)
MRGAGWLGEWDEIVPLIAFLCTPDALWITAQTIHINAGMTA